MDDKTLHILSRLYGKLLERKRPERLCMGCHQRTIRCYEEGQDYRREGYCSSECQAGYHELFKNFSLGQKRVRGMEESRKRLDFTKLLDILDEPVFAQIIVFSYPHYREEISDMRALLDLRGESKQLQLLIDTYILKALKELSPEICTILTNDSILLFPNLTNLYLDSPLSQVNDISRLTNLTRLQTGLLIDDDSLIHLEKLKELIIVGDAPITEHSLSKLTNLEVLFFTNNSHVTDQTLSLLPLSLLTLFLIRCPEIQHGLSYLTNLESLELEEMNFNDYSLSNLRKLKELTITSNEVFVGNDDSLGNMPLLENLFLTNCPNFEGTGFLYKSPLRLLRAAGTKVTNSTLSSQFNLVGLDISETQISDERLGEFIRLESLTVRGCQFITERSLSKLTNLTYLDIADCQGIRDRRVLARLAPNLRELFLDRTRLKAKNHEPLLKFPNLTILSLDDTEALTSREMVYMSNLRELSLSRNKVIQGRAYLRNLTNLTKLYLSYNEVIENEDIQQFTQLEALDLLGNSHIQSKALVNMPNLRDIRLRDGTVTDDYTWVDHA